MLGVLDCSDKNHLIVDFFLDSESRFIPHFTGYFFPLCLITPLEHDILSLGYWVDKNKSLNIRMLQVAKNFPYY